MKIRVLFFAEFRELFGDQRVMDVPEGFRIKEIMSCLKTPSGSLLNGERSLVYAVNENFESVDTLLKDGDDLAIMMPMSGG